MAAKITEDRPIICPECGGIKSTPTTIHLILAGPEGGSHRTWRNVIAVPVFDDDGDLERVIIHRQGGALIAMYDVNEIWRLEVDVEDEQPPGERGN
ncbi:MAG: hypothetical protein JO166_24920 [Deltaproteobacteria bacterium]|nr:hypothetical protein [Deltaproteobacteria bacterium]